MSRRRAAIKRVICPDPRYGSILVGKFINLLMRCGKKSIAENIVYCAVDEAAKNLREDSLAMFVQVIDNVRPTVEVCARRFGGATYQVPREVSDSRAVSLAMKWIVRAANQRKASSMERKLFEEICDAYNNRGNAVKIREDLHKLAAANKAFAHFRW